MIMGGLTLNLLLFIYSLYFNCVDVYTQDIVACGGFIKSDVEINFSLIEVISDKMSDIKFMLFACTFF